MRRELRQHVLCQLIKNFGIGLAADLGVECDVGRACRPGLLKINQQTVTTSPKASRYALEWLIRIVAKVEKTAQAQRFEDRLTSSLPHLGLPVQRHIFEPTRRRNEAEITIHVVCNPFHILLRSTDSDGWHSTMQGLGTRSRVPREPPKRAERKLGKCSSVKVRNTR